MFYFVARVGKAQRVHHAFSTKLICVTTPLPTYGTNANERIGIIRVYGISCKSAIIILIVKY